MFYLYTGNMGAGKSAVLTAEIIQYLKVDRKKPAKEEVVKCNCEGEISCYECEGKGVVTIQAARHIYTNLPIIPNRIAEIVSGNNGTMKAEILKRIHVFEDAHVKGNPDLYKCLPVENIHTEANMLLFWEILEPNSIVVLDEVQKIFWRSSNKFKGTGDASYLKQLIDFITGHRHELHDIYFVTQDKETIHKDIINFIGKYYEIRNSRREPMLVNVNAPAKQKEKMMYNMFSHVTYPWLFFIVEEHVKKGRARWVPIGRKRIPASKELFGCYQSFANLGSHKKVHKDAKSSDKGYDSKKQIGETLSRSFWPLLLMCCMVLAVYLGWRALVGVSKNHLKSKSSLVSEREKNKSALLDTLGKDVGIISDSAPIGGLAASDPEKLKGSSLNEKGEKVSLSASGPVAKEKGSIKKKSLSTQTIRIFGSKGFVHESRFYKVGHVFKGKVIKGILSSGVLLEGTEEEKLYLEKPELYPLQKKPFIIASESKFGDFVTYLNLAYNQNYIVKVDLKGRPFSCNHEFVNGEELLRSCFIH